MWLDLSKNIELNVYMRNYAKWIVYNFVYNIVQESETPVVLRIFEANEKSDNISE